MKQGMKLRTRSEQERIFGIGSLIIFLVFAMVGLYIIASWAGARVIGMVIFVGFLFFSLLAVRFLDATYRHDPEKRRRLIWLLILPGALISLFVSGLDAEVRMTPFRMSFVGFGVCWALSGVYLLLRRNFYLP